jgi:hypothetical protein
VGPSNWLLNSNDKRKVYIIYFLKFIINWSSHRHSLEFPHACLSRRGKNGVKGCWDSSLWELSLGTQFDYYCP